VGGEKRKRKNGILPENEEKKGKEGKGGPVILFEPPLFQRRGKRRKRRALVAAEKEKKGERGGVNTVRSGNHIVREKKEGRKGKKEGVQQPEISLKKEKKEESFFSGLASCSF